MKLIYEGNKIVKPISEEKIRRIYNKDLIGMMNEFFSKVEVPLNGIEMPIIRIPNVLYQCKEYTNFRHKNRKDTLTMIVDSKFANYFGTLWTFDNKDFNRYLIINIPKRIQDIEKRLEFRELFLEDSFYSVLREQRQYEFQNLILNDGVLYHDRLLFIEKDDSICFYDEGSISGTWVDGKKIGHEIDLDKFQNYVEIDRFGSNEKKKEDVKKIINTGYAVVKDGSEIVLGKNEFGDEYKFRLEMNKNETDI